MSPTTSTISVGELRQNPTAVLNHVEDGATVVVLRHNRPIADLVPHRPAYGVSGAEVMARLRRFDLDPHLMADLAAARDEPERDLWG
ncbi:type II toxin-antitoxin system Phd/YefM family antitoxin [Microbacterium sp.]|uniref:type II toxin-antitoxin system Phd/YefM family antitoxin n=1 Tax=Microbacterium sp. TaxID=51671 RepID=UPI00289B2F45|nr:type II toxin-antitoxin system Phd/YefM family antitoxin [Microbacterium sp.]